MRRNAGKTPKALKASGGFGRSWLARTRLMTLRWMVSCSHWVNLHGQGAPLLDRREILVRHLAGAQRTRELVRRRDRVLHRHVDADAADRRHRMRRIANAQEPGSPPFLQPIDRDAEQLDVVPAFQFADPVGEKRRHFDDAAAEGFEALGLHPLDAAFRNDIGALPVIAAIEHDHEPARFDMAERIGAVARLARQAKPQHVHRRAVVLAHESRFFAHGRMASVAADGEVGADRELSLRRPGDQADDAPVFLDQVGRVRLHAQVEGFVALALLGQEVEEVPLRHERDEFAVGGQMAEIGHLKVFGPDLGGQRFDLLMRQLQEPVEEPKLVHQLERRGMNRVAAEVAEEIGVLLQHHDANAGARARGIPASSRRGRRRRCSIAS